MFRKYFAWSFDDGLEQDKKVIEILNQYEMGATFHLNSGLLGEKTYEQYIGNMGFREISELKYNKRRKHFFKYAEHFRIPKDEIKQVYADFEIASHGNTHKNLSKCSSEDRNVEILSDVEKLSEITGKHICGLAYPYGAGGKECEETLKNAGVCYARTVMSSQDFIFPVNPLAMPISCWHISKKKYDCLKQFFEADAVNEDRFFVMFAHGYEFDFGTKESSWDELKIICEMVKSQDNIECCSIGEAFDRHNMSKK